MENKIIYQTKTIYECEPEWKIKLKLIRDNDESTFKSHKEYIQYINEETRKIATTQQLTLKNKIKEHEKKKKKAN